MERGGRERGGKDVWMMNDHGLEANRFDFIILIHGYHYYRSCNRKEIKKNGLVAPPSIEECCS